MTQKDTEKEKDSIAIQNSDGSVEINGTTYSVGIDFGIGDSKKQF